MSLAEVKSILDKLSPYERREVRAYLDRLENKSNEVKSQPFDFDALMAGVDAFRQGLSEAELDEMIALMNEEYVEPDVDEF